MQAKYGTKCTKPGCKFDHSEKAIAEARSLIKQMKHRPCRFGSSCVNRACIYKHPTSTSESKPQLNAFATIEDLKKNKGVMSPVNHLLVAAADTQEQKNGRPVYIRGRNNGVIMMTLKNVKVDAKEEDETSADYDFNVQGDW